MADRKIEELDVGKANLGPRSPYVSPEDKVFHDYADQFHETVSEVGDPVGSGSRRAALADEAFKLQNVDWWKLFEAPGKARGKKSMALDLASNEGARKQQMALLQQLEASRGQDTAAKLQGQKALGESAYRTAQHQGMGGGLASATEGTRQSQGVVSQVGEGALQQDMATRNMQNLLSTQGRGQDFQVTKAQNNLQISQQEASDALVKFYLTLGDDMAMAQKRAAVEREKFKQAEIAHSQAKQKQTTDDIIRVISTMFGGGF